MPQPASVRLVALAQPEPRASEVARRLHAAGHDTLLLSLIRLDPAPFEAEVRAAGAAVAAYDLVIFVSPTAATVFLRHFDGAWPPATAIAVVGSGSVEAIEQRGLNTAGLELVMPHDRSDVDALLAMPRMQSLAGQRVLVVRGSVGREDWIGQLRARAAQVDELIAFRRIEQDPPPAVLARLSRAHDRAQPVAFVVTTTRTAERLDHWLDQTDRGFALWCRSQAVLAIHPRIAAVLERRGWRRVRSIGAGTDALLGALESV